MAVAGITINVRGINEAVDRLDRITRSIPDKMHTLCTKLAEMGLNDMSVNFRTAAYDGTPDVRIGNPMWVSDNVLEIPVTGHTVAFIEFGTGVHYADDHPRAEAMGAIRGEYGHHQGRKDTWKYRGDPGSAGWYNSPKERARGIVTTHGNPANAVMYNAAKQMRERILETARSVFADD